VPKFPHSYSALHSLSCNVNIAILITVPDLVEKELVGQDLTNTSTLSKEDFQSDLELQLHWDPLYKTPEKNMIINRYNLKQCSGPESPMEFSKVTFELEPKLKKLPWKNVYGR
jgi:hypothetical protein